MRYYIDTEFAERPSTIELLSIALVCEDGREFYAVNHEADVSQCNEWVQANVLPKLLACAPYIARPDLPTPPVVRTRADIRDAIIEFVKDGSGTPIEFWGYFADYDWVVFCWLFGAMVDLPKGFPMYCRDLKQFADERSVWKKQLSLLAGGSATPEHNALADARWNKRAHEGLLRHVAALQVPGA